MITSNGYDHTVENWRKAIGITSDTMAEALVAESFKAYKTGDTVSESFEAIENSTSMSVKDKMIVAGFLMKAIEALEDMQEKLGNKENES